MGRASDWWVLGLHGDPTPGVVESVQALAKQFHDFADDSERAWRGLNSFGADATALSWIGQSAEAFKTNFGPLPGRMQKLYVSYREAGDALAAYAPKLSAAQTKADNALRDGRIAYDDVQRLQGQADIAATNLKTAQGGTDPTAVKTAQTAHDTAQSNLSDAKSRLAAATATANHAHDDRVAAAKECAKALHHAQSDGIHNKHWWEHVGAIMSEWGGKIAEIAGELAPILDVIALATSWIPGVDVVTAALAEADNLIALVATAVEIVGDGMQGHWGDALMGAGMLALTFAGGRALGSLGKEAEGEANALERGAARESEGNFHADEAGDPVDIVSGQMVTSSTDLALPGILPLVVRRAYASGYANGRLFGPGWSSTLDQRLSVNPAGIHVVGDDAQTLHYPLPAGGETVLPERGARWPLVWDRRSDEIRVTDPTTGLARVFAVVHHREELGEIRDLTALVDRNGNRLEIARDEQGTPTGVTAPGYRVAVDTAATQVGIRVTALRLEDGTEAGVLVKEYRYDQRGRLTGVVDSTGVPATYEYDDAHRVTAWSDRLGHRYAYRYDAFGRVVRGRGDHGHLNTGFEYRDDERVTVVTDSLGQARTYCYDENGHITAVTDPLGAVAVARRDRFGHVLSSTDRLGHSTAIERDAVGNPLRIHLPGAAVVELAYDEHHRMTSAVGPDGAVWRYGYDAAGNPTRVVDPEGGVTAYTYGAGGRLRTVTDATGSVTRLSVDAAGLSTAVTDAFGATTRITRDAFGRAIRVEDPLGGRTELWWSVEGRLLARVAPDGTRDEWEYDAEGHLTAYRTPTGATTRYEYDAFDLLTARIGPDGTRLTFMHDTELRLVRVADPAGLTWDYAYDAANNLVGERDFAGRAIRYAHDAAGRLLERRVGDGPALVFERDALGNVRTRRSGDTVTTFEYDAVGRVMRAEGAGTWLAYTRDRLGRVTSETVDGRTLRTEYDLCGRRVRRTTPSGVVSAWSFDAAGRADRLSGTAAALSFVHDAAGRETDRRLGPYAALRQTFDAVGRLTGQSITALAEGVLPRVVQERGYVYRADGLVASVADRLRGDRALELDLAGRVTAVRAEGWQEAYAYDASGNLAFAETPAGSGASAADTQGERENSGMLLRRAGRTSYDYDDQGRVVRTVRRTLSGQTKRWDYAWDVENRLSAVSAPDGSSWRYTYDPLGRRTAKHQFGGDGERLRSVYFVWEGTKLAEQAEVGGDGVVETLTWDYEPDSVRAAGQTRRTRPVGAASEAEVDAEFHAIVTDLVGTPMELVAADGSIVWRRAAGLWGQQVAVAEPGLECPLRFPGQYHDPETGWDYNLFRYYDPENARYVTPDPMGLAPAPNHYAYVGNPLDATDPLGLISYDDAKKVAQGMQKRAEDGATKRKAGPPPPQGKGYHGHLPQEVEEDILKNPDAVYGSQGTGDRVIFRKGDNIVVADGKGATKGHIVTSYGPAGPLGPSGVEAYPGSLPTDPGKPVTHDMLMNGQVPKKGGGFLAPCFEIGIDW